MEKVKKEYFNKKVIVTLYSGKTIVGDFTDEFEEDNEILVGYIAIRYDEIKDIKLA